jgi:hypothetical protein
VTRPEAETVREAIADSIRVLADVGDVLLAVSAAARLVVAALERVEQDLISIDSLIDNWP